MNLKMMSARMMNLFLRTEDKKKKHLHYTACNFTIFSQQLVAKG